MLPQTQPDIFQELPTRTVAIHVNPNFSRMTQLPRLQVPSAAHINPLFLKANRAPTIHMNPDFLQQQLLLQQQQQQQQMSLLQQSTHYSELDSPAAALATSTPVPASVPANHSKIISKSRMRIVREPLPADKSKVATSSAVNAAALIRVDKRKLVRRAAVPASTPTAAKTISAPIAHSPSKAGGTKYKIDNRCISASVPASQRLRPSLFKERRRAFVARFALRRSPEQSVVRRMTHALPSSPSAHRKLQLLSINGIIYKSTRNKLHRKDAIPAASHRKPVPAPAKSKHSSEPVSPQKLTQLRSRAVLIVNGTKFVRDKQGFRLTRVPTQPTSSAIATTTPAAKQRQRIDIGGHTYIASGASKNVYVRTHNHLTLAHLNSAKQRSLLLLSRRFVKSNVPCGIFQRLGKCSAYERGRCTKLHDKKRVIICPRFLRGECSANADCLLSHSVSLSKMPVCRFFLQGVCVRQDCPYLHKKLSSNAHICDEFMRGYCPRAEQCDKRHEFVCPALQRRGKCEGSNCVYCKSSPRHKSRHGEPKQLRQQNVEETLQKLQPPVALEDNAAPTARYFAATSTEKDAAAAAAVAVDVEEEVESAQQVSPIAMHARPKVGVLPAYIPLR